MKKAIVGILAHVDSGKTTLAEALLYKSGVLRSPGRVDSGNTVMDNHNLEKQRGITIFTNQAQLLTDDIDITILDTPGHIDFSSETGRVLDVLDYSILVISADDGVQPHTVTLWNLLRLHNIPVFIFVSKMDYSHRTCDEILSELRKELSDSCVNFNSSEEEFYENISLCSENIFEKYILGEKPNDNDISSLIRSGTVFPVYFGSGLKFDGIDDFIFGLEKYIETPAYPDVFGAKVFRITRENGKKIVYLKVTGGTLKVRDSVSKDEKISSIKINDGIRFIPVECVKAGSICKITGFDSAVNGQGLGYEIQSSEVAFRPVMNFSIISPNDVDIRTLMPLFKQLEDEDPQLNVVWDEVNKTIQIGLMGNVQAEILKSVFYERFGVKIDIGECSIQYKETVRDISEGVGHYEPLRHYAEVHLIVEPAERDSGIEYRCNCSEDFLGKNWQNLIMTHLKEKKHKGVLIGAELSDVRITLVAGRAHLKHTEGGDFRQATYRAVRNALMKNTSIILEPYYAFNLRVPYSNLGRAINDINLMHGSFNSPEENGEFAIITGRAPVSVINNYASEVASYTGGKGKINFEFCGYDVCHNTDDVIVQKNYNPEADINNSPDSVFCSHGAGFTVKWDKVKDYMHIGPCLKNDEEIRPREIRRNFHIDDKELNRIMEREFGSQKYELNRLHISQENVETLPIPDIDRKRWVIVDGYNVIFNWKQLKNIASKDLASARDRLMHILCNYSAFTKNEIVLVFDAYKVPGNQGEQFDFNNIHIVYTKERELGDVYIERLVSEIGKNDRVTVVSSDGLIQLSAIRFGVLRKSAKDFEIEIEETFDKIEDMLDLINKNNPKSTIGNFI